MSSLKADRKPLNGALVLGLCLKGPYRHAVDSVLNETVRWISWGYREKYVHPKVRRDIESSFIGKGTRVVFCCWDMTELEPARLLRAGIIDHVSYTDSYVSLTAFLQETLSGSIRISDNGRYLCQFMASEPENE